jgi:hypothetical protein
MNACILVANQAELQEALALLSRVQVPCGCAQCLIEFDGKKLQISPAYVAPVVQKPTRRGRGYKYRGLPEQFRTSMSPRLMEEYAKVHSD